MIDKKAAVLPAIIGLSLFAAIAVLVATSRHGIGTSPDSAYYVGAARNIAAGRGITEFTDEQNPKPLIYFPPLYPLLLAGVGALGGDPLEGARWLAAALMGANVLMVGLVIRKHAGKASWLAVFGAFLVAASGTMLHYHCSALSDSAFIFFGFLGFVFLAAYLDKPRPYLLIAAAVVIGLAFLDRFAGVALVAAGMLGLLLLGGKTLFRRITQSLSFGAVAALPMAIWAVNNLLTSGEATSREFSFHPAPLLKIYGIFSVTAEWLVPGFHDAVQWTAIAAAGAAIFFAWRKQKKRGGSPPEKAEARAVPPLVRLMLIFLAIYLLFIAATMTFFDSLVTFNDRIMLPAFVACVLMLFCAADRIKSAAIRTCGGGRLWTVLAIALAAAYLYSGTIIVKRMLTDGGGYSSSGWEQSATIAAVRNMPADVIIYSNEPHAVYLLTGRAARLVPVNEEESRQRMDREVESLMNQLKKSPTVVVYFKNSHREYVVAEDVLVQKLSLRIVSREKDGTIYGSAVKAEK